MTAQLCLMPLLSEHLGLGFYSGALASVTWLLARIQPQVFWEQTYTGVLLTAISFFIYDSFRKKLTWPWLLLCAALWGVTLLFSPVALFPLVAWLGLLYLRSEQPLRQKLALTVLPLLIVAPWIVRNYRVFHHLVFVRDNLGLELRVSNNSCASFSFEVSVSNGCYGQFHPNDNDDENQRVAAMGEYAYNREQMHLALTWIASAPGQFAKLTGERIVAFWMPALLRSQQRVLSEEYEYSPRRDAFISLFSLASFCGLFLLWRKNRNAFATLMIWLVTFPLIYYAVQYSERYRLPILWAMTLPGCYAVIALARRMWERRRS
jgi:hypothetical protein